MHTFVRNKLSARRRRSRPECPTRPGRPARRCGCPNTIKKLYSELETIIGQAWEDRSLLEKKQVREAIERVVALVDRGELRTAEPVDADAGEWRVNEWVKKAIILYFPIRPMRKMESGELEW